VFYMKFILFAFLFLAFTNALNDRLEGKWNGTVSIFYQSTVMIVTIGHQGDSYTNTLDIPQQNVYGIPGEISVLDNSIKIRWASILAAYEGKLLDNTDEIEGVITQQGFQFSLNLFKMDLSNRQEPQPPYPYNTEEVTFSHDNITLTGTLSTPFNGSDFTAVLLVTGSGVQDRDETILGHKPFLVIADYLTRNGIAVLRYDDRGAGGSSPASRYDTTYSYLDDARAGLKYLTTRKEINPKKIGILGHSEGGTISFLAGNETAFVVSLAGVAIHGKDSMIKQNELFVKLNNPDGWTPEVEKQTVEIFTAIDEITNTKALVEKLLEIIGDDISLKSQIPTLVSPWYTTMVRLDPTEALKSIKCPVFAINGEWDCQVDCELNLSAVKKYVKNATIKHYPKLNHLFQECPSYKESMNYGLIEQTISPEVLEDVKNFISKL